MTACLAVVLAVAGTTSAQAGSIVLTTEWLEKMGLATGVSDTPQGTEELEQAIRDYKRGDFEACLKRLGQMVQAHPEMPPAHALFAKLAFQNNQASLIRPALEQAVAEDPQHPEVFLLFGDLALIERRLTDAAVHLEKATSLALSPRWTAQQRRQFEQLCYQGNASVAEGRSDWEAARAALDGWLKLEPANARARQRLAKALFRLGQQEPAHQELQRAAQEDGTLEPAAITMGQLYTEAGDLKKAKEWINYAVKSDPRSLSAQVGMAAWLLEQGHAEEAQSHAEAAAQLDPKSIVVKRLLGLAVRARKDFARSESIFQALVLESPGDAWVRNQLALVLAEQADEAKRRRALELAELSVRQNPNAADALLTLGTVYYRLHRLEEAEKILQAVVESGKASSDAAYILARVRADHGHPEGAPALLKTALAAPGLFVFRSDAQQWLDRMTASQ